MNSGVPSKSLHIHGDVSLLYVLVCMYGRTLLPEGYAFFFCMQTHFLAFNKSLFGSGVFIRVDCHFYTFKFFTAGRLVAGSEALHADTAWLCVLNEIENGIGEG